MVESERKPVERRRGILETSQVTRARLQPVHDEVSNEIKNRKPPELRVHDKTDRQSNRSVHETVRGQRQNEIPTRPEFTEHVRELKWEIRNEMLQLKNQEQNKGVIECRDANQEMPVLSVASISLIRGCYERNWFVRFTHFPRPRASYFTPYSAFGSIYASVSIVF